MQRLGMEEGVPIESRFVSKQIENAQKRVEGQNFGYRKHVLEYDDVMNKQREAIYGLRTQLLEGEDQKEYLMGIADDIMIELCRDACVGKHTSRRMGSRTDLQTAVLRQFGFDFRAEGIDPSQTRVPKKSKKAARQGARKIRSEGSHHRRRQPCGITNACSCCRSWIRSGRITFSRWTT